MTFAALALGAGGVANAAAGLFQDTPQPGEALTSSLSLRNDPVNAALAFDALLNLGNLDGAEMLLQRGSPLNTVMDQINQAPLSIFHKNAANTVLRQLYDTGTLPPLNAQNQQILQLFNEAIASAGVDQTALAQINPQSRDAFNARVKEHVTSAAATGTGAARASAQRQLSDRVLGMANGGASSFRGLTDVATNVLSQNLEEKYRLQRNNALSAANAGGYNPAGILGELEKEYLRQNSAMPLNANQLGATLAANEDRDFNNLMSYLLQGTQSAQQSAQVTNQAALGSAGIAANQLNAANQYRQGQSNPTGDALESIGGSLTTAGLLGASGFFGKPGASQTKTTITGSSPSGGYDPWAQALGMR